MILEKSTRLALIICGTIWILGLAGFTVISGTKLDLEELLTASFTHVGALLVGLGWAGGPSKKTGALVLSLLFVGLASSGCGRCVTERAVVDALGAGVGAAGVALANESDDEDIALALATSRGAVLLGDAAVDGCEHLRDGGQADGWQTWVGLGLEAAMGLVQIFTGASGGVVEDVPPELTRAVELLETGASCE